MPPVPKVVAVLSVTVKTAFDKPLALFAYNISPFAYPTPTLPIVAPVDIRITTLALAVTPPVVVFENNTEGTD